MRSRSRRNTPNEKRRSSFGFVAETERLGSPSLSFLYTPLRIDPPRNVCALGDTKGEDRSTTAAAENDRGRAKRERHVHSARRDYARAFIEYHLLFTYTLRTAHTPRIVVKRRARKTVARMLCGLARSSDVRLGVKSRPFDVSPRLTAPRPRQEAQAGGRRSRCSEPCARRSPRFADRGRYARASNGHFERAAR